MTKTELMTLVTTTLDKALDSDDAETRDSLTRVAQGYANLLPFAE